MAKIVRFDCFEVDLAAGQVYKRGTPLRLPDQQFRVLASLLERPGQVVTREDLRRRLWPDDVFVDFENNLNIAVARLRQALGDSAEQPRFVETLPKRGYRFLPSVTKLSPGQAIARRPGLVVLPFVNATGDSAQEYFSDAITDDLITDLAALAPDALGVIARTTAIRYKGTRKDVAHIGRELGVDYLVEGSVRRVGDSVAVNAQLIRVSDQALVWARRYEGPSGDLASTLSSVAQAIAGALGLDSGQRGGEHAGTGRRISPDPIAGNEYIQGRYHLDRMNLRLMGAEIKPRLERAIARDPGFALAHEAMAQMYWILGYAGFMPPRDAFGAGVLHAVRAIEIDGTSAEARALVAQYRKQLDYDWPEIERELSAALQMNPASTLVRVLYAVGWLMPQGRIQDAIAELERALELDPLSYHVHHWLTVMFGLARDWDRTIHQANLMIELEPDIAVGPWLLSGGLRGQGLLDQSVASQQRAVDLSEGAPMMLGWFGLILGINDRTDEARAVLHRLEAIAQTATYVPPSSFAWVYLGLRDVNRTFGWLDRAVDARDQFMMPIKTYAFFDPIRSDPRFTALLRKMKLA